MQAAHGLEVSDQSFQADVLEASKKVPVVVDFWAPWCGPCRTLGPILEKLAGEFGGRFRLAKVNSDENPEVSREFNVRSIPDVRAFRDGKEVANFTGALPERQVRAFIEQVAPAPAEIERQRGAALRASGNVPGAISALQAAVALDPAHHLARVDLAELLLDAGKADDADRVLEPVPPAADWDARVAALKLAIGYARSGGNEQDLAARVAANPSDLDARLALAGALVGKRAWREAMDELLEIIRQHKSWKDGEARKQMLAIFSLAAGDADLVSDYRRKLASALN